MRPRADRLRRRWCELCDHGATVTVHHVAKLAQRGKPGPGQPAWAALMARKRRKTLIVCRPCHDYIHANPIANAAFLHGWCAESTCRVLELTFLVRCSLIG